ncbi:MAG TPA: hypothetical protein VMV17_06735 [Streptosporangiaceae bacterium]|nr:hypothetical protein [Streptosporangiaceae bacterium]
MRVRTWAALAAVVVAVIASCSSAPVAPGAGRNHGAGSRTHSVNATESGTGRSASMTVTDPYADGTKLRRIEYHLHDGYTKRVIIPGGAYVAAEDIAICGTAGQSYPTIGFIGTGLPCKPRLHTAEVRYHQHVGDLIGRFRPHHDVEVTEISHGSGRYLTFGHIDHGALMAIEYYWANGEHLTVHLPGDVLVDHIQVITRGGHLAAAVVRHS